MTKWKCSKYDCMLSPCVLEARSIPHSCPLLNLTTPEWEKQEEPATTATTTATLPDWCKVGEWVATYDRFKKKWEYFRIATVQKHYVTSENGLEFFAEELKPARLRPYNAEELKALVGKVIESKNKVDCLLVTAYNSGKELDDVASVMTLGEWVTAEELLRIGYTIDEKPCGKFEHLNDAGEWEA